MLRIYFIYAVNFSFKVNIVKRKIRHRHSHLFIFKETRPTSNEVGKAHRVASGAEKLFKKREAWLLRQQSRPTPSHFVKK